MKRVWGDPHQDKTHRLTGGQMTIPLNMGGSCSVCVPLYITKRSEAVLQWGKRKNIKKLMINGELVIEWKKEKMHKGCSCGEYLL